MRAIRVLLALLVCLGLGVDVVGWYGDRWYQAAGPATAPATLVFARGASVREMARVLADAGEIDHPMWFTIAEHLTRSAGELKAGEYALPAAASPQQILGLLRSGKTVIHRLIVPEGLSSAEIVSLVEQADALSGGVAETPAEGSLMPQTYFYSYGDQRQALVDRMRAGMRKLVAEVWAARRPDLPISTPAEAVIVASIVEKETAIPSERSKVAGVFYNRLKRGMRLQADPTVVYAITGGKSPLGHRLDHDDLAVQSPYNTYASDGLPPGPIDNPGRASLLAAVEPQDTDALYFVADGSGGHAFATTLETHRQNVDRWRAQRDATVPTPAVKPKPIKR